VYPPPIGRRPLGKYGKDKRKKELNVKKKEKQGQMNRTLENRVFISF
jgi:hypothetical protein